MEVRVECHCCQGTGTIPLTGYYLETYQTAQLICKKKTDFIVAGRDCERFGCNATALNNRLAALEKHGLLYSERWGRERRFYLCSQMGAKP